MDCFIVCSVLDVTINLRSSEGLLILVHILLLAIMERREINVGMLDTDKLY